MHSCLACPVNYVFMTGTGPTSCYFHKEEREKNNVVGGFKQCAALKQNCEVLFLLAL